MFLVEFFYTYQSHPVCYKHETFHVLDKCAQNKHNPSAIAKLLSLCMVNVSNSIPGRRLDAVINTHKVTHACLLFLFFLIFHSMT